MVEFNNYFGNLFSILNSCVRLEIMHFRNTLQIFNPFKKYSGFSSSSTHYQNRTISKINIKIINSSRSVQEMALHPVNENNGIENT